MATIVATSGTTTGTTTDDNITGTAGNDVINAGGGDDVVYAGDGNDTVRGGDGNDTLYGGAGSDILDGGTGGDTLVGGTGNDTYTVDSTADVVIELNGEGVDLVKSYVTYILGNYLENLTLLGTDQVDGSGNSLNNSIVGNTANNWLYGMAGNDQIDGGVGNDVLFGGVGSDWLNGGAGGDSFVFAASDVAGGIATDQIADLNFCADDQLLLSGYYDGGGVALDSYADIVRLMDSRANVTVTKKNESGIANIAITTPNGTQTIALTDTSGKGTAWAQFEAAAVRPVANGDSATTSEKSPVTLDVLANDSGPDLSIVSASVVKGQATIVDNKILFDPQGDFNYLAAGENAVVTVDYRVETAAGRWTTGHAAVTVTGVNDAPEITGTHSGDVWEDGDGVAQGHSIVNDPDQGQSSFQAGTTAGTFGSLSINAAGEWTYTLDQNAQPLATLNSGESAIEHIVVHTADGSNHSVEITVHGSDEVVTKPTAYEGADPNDNDGVTGGGVLFSTVTNFNGADILYGTTGADTIDARSGNDKVYGWGGDDIISGGNGVDVIYGGSGNDQLFGNQAVDALYGGSGNDIIKGIAGDDVLIGGYGADELTGNDGADTFRFLDVRDTNDTITDFTSGLDKIDLSNLFANGQPVHFAAPVEAHTFTAQRDLIWFFDGTNTVILGNTDGDLGTAEFMITLTSNPALHAADFLL